MINKQRFAKEMGNRIMLLRDKNHYTREQLAELAEISSKYLYEIELGRKNCSSYYLSKLAQSLNTSAEYLIKGTEFSIPNTNSKSTDKKAQK